MRISSPTDLGALVRQERQDQGLTQAELAERAGTTRQWVVQFEAGAPNARLELVLATLRALDLIVDVRSASRPAPAPRRSPVDVYAEYLKAANPSLRQGGTVARALGLPSPPMGKFSELIPTRSIMGEMMRATSGGLTAGQLTGRSQPVGDERDEHDDDDEHDEAPR